MLLVQPKVFLLKVYVLSNIQFCWFFQNYNNFTPRFKSGVQLGMFEEAKSCISQPLCLVLAVLMQESLVLSLGVTPNHSWWKDNGPGCRSLNLPAADWQKQQNLELTTVRSCWLEYYYIEVLHCIPQLLLSVSLVQLKFVCGFIKSFYSLV